MPLTKFTDDMDIVSRLTDAPVLDGSLTESQFKAKFDQGVKAIKAFINNILTPELDAELEARLREIPDGAITGSKIASGAVTGGKLSSGAVTGAKISDGAVTEEKLSAGAVTTEKFADGAIAPSAEKLNTARSINGVAFDGTADIETRLVFTNVSVAASAFTSDATYTDFPYRAAVALTGVTAAMFPEVVFAPAEALSGLYAPVSESYDGGVYLYASEVPAGGITVPSVVCWR